MMSRLPIPGGDEGSWGAVLNDFLIQTHNADGTLQSGSVTTSKLADGAVTPAKLDASNVPSAGQYLTYGGSVLTWVNGSGGGTVADADAATKGVLRLTGDLGGTADSPTVPGLAGKADAATTVAAGTGLTGGGNLSANRTLAADFGTAAGTITQGNDARLSDARTPLDGSVTNASVAAGAAIGLSKLATDPLARANHTGTQTAATISDFAAAVAAALTVENLPAGTTLTVLKNAGTWPARPTARADIIVQWKGSDPSPALCHLNAC
jgi:hypothetical protein